MLLFYVYYLNIHYAPLKPEVRLFIYMKVNKNMLYKFN